MLRQKIKKSKFCGCFFISIIAGCRPGMVIKVEEQVIVQILELLQTTQEICQELYTSAEMEDSVIVEQICADIIAGQKQILQSIKQIATPGNHKLSLICESIVDSTQRVRRYFRANREMCLKKIEFELLPLIQEAYGTYYFFQYLADHPEEISEYYEKKKNLLYCNEYIDEARNQGQFKYDVSISILAYNKLNYTKQCVESVLRYLPENLNYELILINHGSNDGTKEYFEKISPDKQLDIVVNGGGAGAVSRIVEGEFHVMVSNDVIVTPYAIENLLACIHSDSKIAWAVPATPNVSNFQSIPANYNSMTELMSFACRNNSTDSFRWEQRVRLCNPVDIRRSSVFYGSSGLCLDGWFHTTDPVHSGSFPDDRVSLLLRRNGYKMMLVKDAYCHHFGSVTLKDEITSQNEQKYYQDGRKEFFHAFGVDPWGTGFCYDPVFLDCIVNEYVEHINILGINCGLGSNSLKIKEQFKEFFHNKDSTLINITDNSGYILDLRGISEETNIITSVKELERFMERRFFHYIVWETPFLTKDCFPALLGLCLNHLVPTGKLLIKLTEQSSEAVIQKYPNHRKIGENWALIEH